jgi:hypothetical protein
MKSNYLPLHFLRALIFAGLVLTFSIAAYAQFEPASPPIADPKDQRFKNVEEDWTSLSLASSRLIPAHPLLALTDDHPHCTVELLQVQWRWGDPIDLYVMKPKGVKKPPVILYLYGYPTDTTVFRDDAYEDLVTKNGVAAVGFVSALTGHRYHDRPMKEWFLSEFQESLAKSVHDVQMVLNYLDSRGDLDMDRVGMFTNGSGASIAILASTVDPRIKVIEALDPWGDWPNWLANSPFVPSKERPDYVKPEFLKKVAAFDPLPLLPKIQARKFRLDNEAFNTTTPAAIEEKFRAAVPPGSTVMVYKSYDEAKAAFADGKNLEWIQHELEALPGPAPSNTAPDKPSR